MEKHFLERLKNRRDVLLEERNKLRSLNAQLDTLRKVEEHEQSLNDKCRETYLEKVGARNDAEIQLLKVRGKIQKFASDVERLEREREEYEELAKAEKDRWEEQVSTIYAPEALKMELYVECLQNTIHTKQEIVQLRESRLVEMKGELMNLKNEGERVDNDINIIRGEIEALERDIPAGRDEEMTVLSDLFTETLREVSSINDEDRSKGSAVVVMVVHVDTIVPQNKTKSHILLFSLPRQRNNVFDQD